ncbi:MAG: sigma-70 family RNA polymerase sigma factor [Bacteroidia bacterium]
MEDTLFIERLRKGDSMAYSRLVQQFQARVFNTCLNFVFDRTEAEDLTQEVFLEVYRSIGAFEERSSLSTWIYRISVTKSLELIRSKSRKKRAGMLLSIFGLQEKGWDVRGHVVDHPGFQLENQERAQRLHAALHSLPENQRVAFTMHKLDGHRYEEVAEIMGISLASVESLIFRARKNLQKTLEKFYQDEG